jgi:hypothetical protein
MKLDKLRYALFLVPWAVLYWNAEVAHWDDLDEFNRWSMHERKNDPSPPPAPPVLGNLYLNTQCNYPPLGALLSAGALSLLKSAQASLGRSDIDPRQVFRVYLSVFEILSLALLIALLTRLEVPSPWLVALGLYLLPSTWAGGATWGQIDVVDTVCLLVAAGSFLRVIAGRPAEISKDLLWLCTGAVALVASMQIKQLSLFCFPGLTGLWIAGLVAIAYRHGARRCSQAALACVVLGALVFLGLDRFVFVAPPGFHGISSYVWSVGVWHTRYLTNNGPSLWTFLQRDGSSSSEIPFFSGLTPKEAGYTAFLLLFAFMSLVHGLYGLRVLASRARFEAESRTLCRHLLCFVGLTNWSMGVFLVGTHERHMFLTFPFLLLGLFGLRQTEAREQALPWIRRTVFAALLYGCYVYGVIARDAFQFLFVLRSQAFVAAFLMTTFASVFIGYHRYLLGSLRRPRPQPAKAAARRPRSS